MHSVTHLGTLFETECWLFVDFRGLRARGEGLFGHGTASLASACAWAPRVNCCKQ